MTSGDDDPAIPRHLRAAHDRAVAAGEALYEDPDSGLWVMTAPYLRERGFCCGKGCRHCPWPPEVQRDAGRPKS